jgi:hypothetical protein
MDRRRTRKPTSAARSWSCPRVRGWTAVPTSQNRPEDVVPRARARMGRYGPGPSHGSSCPVVTARVRGWTGGVGAHDHRGCVVPARARMDRIRRTVDGRVARRSTERPKQETGEACRAARARMIGVAQRGSENLRRARASVDGPCWVRGTKKHFVIRACADERMNRRATATVCVCRLPLTTVMPRKREHGWTAAHGHRAPCEQLPFPAQARMDQKTPAPRPRRSCAPCGVEGKQSASAAQAR